MRNILAKTTENLFLIFKIITSTILITSIIFYAEHMALNGLSFNETNESAKEMFYYAQQQTIGTEEDFYISHKVNKLMNKEVFLKEQVASPVVCQMDSLDDGHKERVQHILHKFYDGEIRFFDELEYDFWLDEEKNKKLLECDIINYSLGLELEEGDYISDYGHDASYIQFLKEWDGLIVASAGNTKQKDAAYQQGFVRIQKTNPEFADRIIVVGQLTNKTGELKNNAAAGEGIDIVVPNGAYISKFQGEYAFFAGTSFAAPVVTAIAANLMSHYTEEGSEEIKERIMKHTGTFSENINGNHYVYPILNIKEVYQN